MEEKISLVLVIILFLVITLLNIESIFAFNLGVSPASISFEDVLREGYAERNVVISVDSIEPVEVELEARGDIAEWINFSEKKFNVSRNNFYYLTIYISPPEDIPNGDYVGFLRLKTSSIGGGVEDHAVGLIRSNLDLTVNVRVTDIEIKKCSVSFANANSVEEGDDIVFFARVKNEGNVRINPDLTADIWDQEQVDIIKSEEGKSQVILPTKEGNISFRVNSNNLDLGQYFAEFSIPDCYFSQILTFDILEEGALKAEGILSEITIKKTAKVGETVPFFVRFKNTGEKELEAQFKGQINRGENIVQILESEKFTVPVSGFNDFTFYFTPEKTGSYAISGRVFYNNKRTFESSAILEVISDGINLKSFLIFLTYLLFLILIVYLIYKIRNERKSYYNKLRRIKNGF